MHALLYIACLQQVGLQVLMDSLHCPQVASHMAPSCRSVSSHQQ